MRREQRRPTNQPCFTRSSTTPVIHALTKRFWTGVRQARTRRRPLPWSKLHGTGLCLSRTRVRAMVPTVAGTHGWAIRQQKRAHCQGPSKLPVRIAKPGTSYCKRMQGKGLVDVTCPRANAGACAGTTGRSFCFVLDSSGSNCVFPKRPHSNVASPFLGEGRF